MTGPVAHPRPSRNATIATARAIVLWTLAFLIALAVVLFTARVMFVIFAGVLFAIALRAAARFMAKHTHTPYLLQLTLIVLFVLAATVAVIILIVPRLREEFERFSQVLPSSIHAITVSLGLKDVLPVGAQSPDLGKLHLERYWSGALSTLGTTFDALAGLVICFFVAIYGAASPAAYERVVMAVVPSPSQVLAKRIIRAAVRNLERWLLGRLVAMIFVGVTCGIAFSLLRIPLAIPLALLAGALTFVEYIGAIASAIPAVLLAFGQSSLTALWVAVIFTVLHAIEGYVLTPLLARTAVHFPPAVTLVGQTIFGALIGPLGLTFSTPLLVVFTTAGKEWKERSSA